MSSYNDNKPIGYGRTRYEIGLYDDGKLLQVYRTDTIEGVPVLLSFAESHANYLGIEAVLRSNNEEVFKRFEEVQPG